MVAQLDLLKRSEKPVGRENDITAAEHDSNFSNIEASVNGILTALAGGTTGQLVSKTNNNDHEFTFVDPGGGGLTTTDVKTVANNNETSAANTHVPTTTAGGAFTLNLPAAPAHGDEIEYSDIASSWSTASLTIGRNGNTIDGLADNYVLDGGVSARLKFNATANGGADDWDVIFTAAVSGGVTAHATSHVTGGGDVIADAVASGNSGLMSGADKAKLDGVEVGAAADQSAAEVPFTPAGNISALNVQAGLEELDDLKAAAAHGHTLGDISDAGALAAQDTVTAAQISDSTTDGRAVLTAADANPYTDAEQAKLAGIEAGATGDQSAAEVSFTAAGTIAATNVQAALEELDAEKAASAHGHDDAEITAAASATNYTPTGATVEGHLAGIDTALGSAGAGGFVPTTYQEITGTSETLNGTTDPNGSWREYTAATAITVTVESTVPDNAEWAAKKAGAGALTYVAGAGVTFVGSGAITGQATIKRKGSSATFEINGATEEANLFDGPTTFSDAATFDGGIKVPNGSSVAGTLTMAAHGGGMFSVGGNVTVPNEAGFSVLLHFLGEHTISAGGATQTPGTGNSVSVYVPAAGTVLMTPPITPTALAVA